MAFVSNRKFIWLLLDGDDRSFYWEGGKSKTRSLPFIQKTNPDGEKDVTLQFATNEVYTSTIRQFTNAVNFVAEAKKILLDRAVNGKGTEEEMYAVLMQSDPSIGLNGYKLCYKGRLDFSKLKGDATNQKASINALQDDVFAFVQANENNNFPIQCNASNPAAIKVLFDGILMQDKLNYNYVSVPIVKTGANNVYAWPVTYINNEGDNVGVIFNSQNFENPAGTVKDYVTDPANSNYLYKSQRASTVYVKGRFSFTWSSDTNVSSGFQLFFTTSLNNNFVPPANFIFTNNGGAGPAPDPTNLIPGKTYTIEINKVFNLAAEEKLFMIGTIAGGGTHFTITPLITDFSLLFASQQFPTTAYALRPLDYLQQIVNIITEGEYTADSNFFRNNNRKVILSGSSLRNFPDSVINSNFSSFFKSYTVAYWLGVVVRDGILYVEPIEDIYNNKKELFNLGEVAKVTLEVAQSKIYTAVDVGYAKQTYNKRNGRYDYNNGKHSYKFPINAVQNKLDLISPWRADPFGMEYIRTGYSNLNTTDDKGDSDIWTVMISDTVGQTDGTISNAISFSVESLILATPIIKSPYNGVLVYNENPTIGGISQPGKIITVYADGAIDGTTLADADGNWTYQVQNPLRSKSAVFNGVHTLQANAQTDPGNISGFSKTLSLTVDTTHAAPFLVTSPTNNDTLYNNLPLIAGIAPAGAVITILEDVTVIGTVITNSSGLWRMQTSVPIDDGFHAFRATSPGLPDSNVVSTTFNKNVTTPLITNFSYGDIIFNNLPLVKGVAIPGTVVSVYLDGGGGPVVGGIPGPLGTTIADANGDWQFQIVDVVDSSGVTTAYIPDGLHVLATTATPIAVLSAVSGFKLMRGTDKGPVMDYDAIRLDDQFVPAGIDPATLPPTLGQFLHPETLFNIEETTPLTCLLAHAPQLAGFLSNQPDETIRYSGSDATPNLVRKKNNVILNEGQSVMVKDLPKAVWHPWILNFTTRIQQTYDEILRSINNDGYISLTVKDVPVYVLPLGKMQMKPVSNDAQQWSLLVSSKTPLINLIKIFENGLTLNLGKNMVYFSDLNPLHFVKYNFTPSPKYHFKGIYDDWQKNRYPSYVQQPDYVQPWQTTDDPIPLQCITNGVGNIQIHLIDVQTAQVVQVFPFVGVPISPVSAPNVLMQCDIDMSTYPTGLYWFALFVDGEYIAITNKVDLQVDHDDTFLYSYPANQDKVDYYFSTGIKPAIRVQSFVSPLFVDGDRSTFQSDNGNYYLTRGVPGSHFDFTLGSRKYLIADWMVNKMNQILLLPSFSIDAYAFSNDSQSKLEPFENDYKGFPDTLHRIELVMAENRTGFAFATPGDTSMLTHTTNFVLDATAFGQNSGVVNVTADEN
jgi:hypothetical protein